MKKPRVVVAMSGGVDSSVAAALLKKAGYDVTGMFLRTWFDRSIDPKAENRCCSVESNLLARQSAAVLGIPFTIVNALVPFREYVVDYFLAELQAGRTPNPCIPCNRVVRFQYLLAEAKKLGADYLATGHYLRLQPSGRTIHVWRGRDRKKDQSYFQYTLTQAKLQQLLFPLGSYTKSQVRKLAAKYGLPSASREESQDLCFIPKGKYERFLLKYLVFQPGEIVTTDRRVVGRHKGLPLYTIGQRSGLEIGGHGPYYVVSKDAKKNRLMVARADEESRYQKDFYLTKTNFISGQPPRLPYGCHVQTRYRQQAQAAVFRQRGSRYQVVLKKPTVGLTPGQSAVLYHGDELVGGGIIRG